MNKKYEENKEEEMNRRRRRAEVHVEIKQMKFPFKF